jgi:hypothetical protein
MSIVFLAEDWTCNLPAGRKALLRKGSKVKVGLTGGHTPTSVSIIFLSVVIILNFKFLYQCKSTTNMALCHYHVAAYTQAMKTNTHVSSVYVPHHDLEAVV